MSDGAVFMFEIEQIRSVAGAKWLQKSDRPTIVKGVGIDSREDLTYKAFIAIKGDTHDGHDHLAQAVQKGSPLLIVETAKAMAGAAGAAKLKLPPNVAVMHVENTRKALGRIAHAHRLSLRGTKVIGVVGSSGKTTTKRLIHGVLSASMHGSASPKSFNNDIGVPLTLLAAKSNDKYLVVEIGTNAPGEIADLSELVVPDIAVITMVGREHLEGLGTVEDVAREEAAVLDALPSDGPGDGIAIINADCPLLRPHFKRCKTRILFGENDDADLRLTDRSPDPEQADHWRFEVNGRVWFSLALPGRHNAMNALAAVAVGRRMGLDDETIRAGLLSVKPDAMRMMTQVVGGVTFHNDAYNANPDSVAAALETFAEITANAPRRVVLLGDMLELGDEAIALHREVGDHLSRIHARSRLDHVVLVGELMTHAADRFRIAAGNDHVSCARNIDDAVAIARRIIRPEDVVLVKASRGIALERVIAAFESPAQGDPKRGRAAA